MNFLLNIRSKKYLLILLFTVLTQIILYSIIKEPKLKNLGNISSSITNILQPKDELYAINFFASWCGACNQEHNLLLYIAEELKLPIYGIALNESKSNIESFLASEGNPYKKLVVDFPVEILSMLNITNIPRTLIILNGRIVYDQKGPFNKFIVQQNIIPLLNKAKE